MFSKNIGILNELFNIFNLLQIESGMNIIYIFDLKNLRLIYRKLYG